MKKINSTEDETMTAKIRLSTTLEEMNNWVTFFKALESASVIQLLEISDNYPSRGNSQYQRVYLEAKLLIDISASLNVNIETVQE